MAHTRVVEFLGRLAETDKHQDAERDAEIEVLRSQYLRHSKKLKAAVQSRYEALINVYADLVQQRWAITVSRGRVWGEKSNGDLSAAVRTEKRQRFTVRHREQLRESSVQEFINKMERNRLTPNGRVSIFSLMRDGRDLANALQKADVVGIEDIVKPYIQFVNSDEVCAHTGLNLQDIWRYFRHTWSNPYESLPGRGMLYLVRDAAAENHPVMGIGAISSAAIRLEARDAWIGWDTDTFLAECETDPSSKVADWAERILAELIEGIYRLDLIKDRVLPAKLPAIPTNELLDRLKRESEKARELHHRLTGEGENKHKKLDGDAADEEWEKQAVTPLYRSKRCAELANLLELRGVVSSHFKDLRGKERLVSLLSTGQGRGAFSKIIRAARAVTVGTEIADLTVCGAVAPYNEMLGGKLVAMLAVSPAVVAEYRRRYRQTASIIASSMAGRRVVRPNNLVFVGTTSLYGVRPNQYDRASIPCEIIGGEPGTSIRYKFIEERTSGVGTFHFSRTTKAAIENFARQENNDWRVNNVFGEGTSPKLRALRDGLALLGMPADELLKHGLEKAMYGVSLVSNLRDYLLNLSPKPKYLFDLKQPEAATAAISRWWFDRWVKGRIARPEIIDRIKLHALIHPIRHGARVKLPSADIEQIEMFEH